MSEERSSIDRLKELMHGIHYAMLTTESVDDGNLRSRPMTLQQTEFDGQLWLFTGRNSTLVADIEENPRVNLAFANPKDASYVSVGGVAEVIVDLKKAEELWSPVLKAWFPDGPRDTNLALIKVHVECADYWRSASSTMVQIAGFAKAVLMGEKYQGEGTERRHIELDS